MLARLIPIVLAAVVDLLEEFARADHWHYDSNAIIERRRDPGVVTTT